MQNKPSLLPFDSRRLTVLVSKYYTAPEPTGVTLHGIGITRKNKPLHELVLLKHIDDSIHVALPIHEQKGDWFIHPAVIFSMHTVASMTDWVTLTDMKRLAVDLPRGKIPFYKRDTSVAFY